MIDMKITWYMELCSRLGIYHYVVIDRGFFGGLDWELPVETFTDLPRMALTGQIRHVRDECNAYLYNNGKWIRISALAP